MRRIICIFAALLFFASLFGVETDKSSSKTEDGQDMELMTVSPQLAMSNPLYEVTAGDIYRLSYMEGNSPESYIITLDSSYKIRVLNLGFIDANGKTYLELKKDIETLILKNYPLGVVQFALVTPARFEVTLTGEVASTAEVQAWPLMRLSDVLQKNLTPYSCERDISITSKNGKTKTYDLFAAKRFGNLSQDPYLRPGDVITIAKCARSVTIAGDVERPGVYQLRPDENLDSLIHLYGAGYTPIADQTQIEIVRQVEGSSRAGNKIYVRGDDNIKSFELKNFDNVFVHENSELQPVIFMEGAINSPVVSKSDTPIKEPESSTRISVRFQEGENYASFVRRNHSMFFSVSDTSHAYVIRSGKIIPMNLDPLLYNDSYTSDFFLEKNDVLVIPFRQYFVTVSGAVNVPGRYPYIPDRSWDYYVGLAGGFDSDKNSGRAIIITDVAGKTHHKNDPITPETNIEANSNSFLYYFNKYSPIIVTSLTVVSTMFTIKAVTGN